MEIDKLKQQLIEHEGLKLVVYRCSSGRLTIGVGRNLQDKGISKDEAIHMLENDIKECISGVGQLFSNFDELGDVRQRVLVDMSFNLGLEGLKRFRKMRTAVEESSFDKAAAEMLDSRWANQVGRRAERLASMMREGE